MGISSDSNGQSSSMVEPGTSLRIEPSEVQEYVIAESDQVSVIGNVSVEEVREIASVKGKNLSVAQVHL
ncbi:hypothetical protein V6N13_043305 [Hibiscus sabdariffa]